jgi:hypothetical protein
MIDLVIAKRGLDARYADHPVAACPFPWGVEAASWLFGWDDAEVRLQHEDEDYARGLAESDAEHGRSA